MSGEELGRVSESRVERPCARAEGGAIRSPVALFVFAVLAVGSASCREAGGREPMLSVPGGNADSGRVAIERYGCGSCHSIPGIRDARGMVGPPLTAWARRTIIAGEVPNTPDFLVRWIQVPQAIEPDAAIAGSKVGARDGSEAAA